jgi:GDP-L-fucose synthase
MSMPNVSQLSKEVQGFFRHQPILITGGEGFLGKHVVNLLRNRLHASVYEIRHQDYDLRDSDDAREATRYFMKHHCRHEESDPILIHLAAVVSGIHSTSAHPVAHLEDNALMATNILRSAAEYGIHRVVAAGSVCGYPENCPVPMIEENFWEGKPEPTNFSYGMSKRYLLALLDSYKRERLIKNYAYLASANLYGPGDNFDPKSSHVIPALIHNADMAAELKSPLEVWGSGRASRDFLYVWDAALAYVIAAFKVCIRQEPYFVNIGTGSEITIDYIARQICDLMGVQEGIVYDREKPDGQQRRCLSIDRAKTQLGWEPRTEIKEGLKKTIRYYNEYIRANVRQVS